VASKWLLDRCTNTTRLVDRTACELPVGIQARRISSRNFYCKDLTTMKTWMCLICGWIYDEEKGAPDDGIAPGTKWEDVPPNWTCPECGARKEDFEMVEI
jgi:rubredoxin